MVRRSYFGSCRETVRLQLGLCGTEFRVVSFLQTTRLWERVASELWCCFRKCQLSFYPGVPFLSSKLSADLPGVAHSTLFSGPLSRAAAFPRLRRVFSIRHVRRWVCDCGELDWLGLLEGPVEKMGVVMRVGEF
jgi:hypothetical protein